MKRNIKIELYILGIFFIAAIIFLFYSYNNFKVHESFVSIPLSFDSVTSTSTYNWNSTNVKIQGGFVKGKITDKKIENLILRSISPNTVVTIKSNNNANKKLYLRIENIDPSYIKISGSKIDSQKTIDSHTISLVLTLNSGEEKKLEFTPSNDSDYSEFVILGDNRNGYDTFSKIIDQINVIKPIFVIDNGDLVYGGQPNKYRLFYENASKLKVPLYTTLGNHDIRINGRPTYTKLFGPAYYSFDYGRNHFIFLDSSRGWGEKQAIPEEQYTWLENDLKAASGKRIFVISHIPSTDPRSDAELKRSTERPGKGWFQQIVNTFKKNESPEHGFKTREEADRFENLMTKYNVDTVFFSHIHSYYSYVEGNVRYIVTGGAGAELLTTDSYYHYIRVKLTDKDYYTEMIQLPSPSNNLQDRYMAAGVLFTKSIYKEYKTIVLLIASILGVALLWLLYITRKRWWNFLKFIGTWFWDIIKFSGKRYKIRRAQFKKR